MESADRAVSPRIDGIDVARYQLAIDWTAVPASIRWTACKATQGTTYVDPTFEINRLGMARTGRHWRLFYHWLTPTATPEAQAAHFLKTVGQLDPGEGLMLDAEAGITAEGCARFCELVEAATGRPVAVYSGVYVARGTLWKSPQLFAEHRPRLLAAYISELNAARIAGPYGWDVWQWSSQQTIPGIPARCDVNQVDRTDRLDAACGLNQPVPAPTPVPPQEDDDMPAKTLFIGVEGSPSQYTWTPGSKPQGLVDPPQRDIVLAALGISAADGITVSRAQFDEWNA